MVTVGQLHPTRRVSIYAEGMLHALCLDLEIRKRTANAYSLDTLMRRLYADAVHGLQYNEVRLLELLFEITDTSFEAFFTAHYMQPMSMEAVLNEALHHVGCGLLWTASENEREAYFGIRMKAGGEPAQVGVVAPGSAAAIAGLVADDLVLGHEITETGLQIRWRDQMMHSHEAILPRAAQPYFRTVRLVRLSEVSSEQEASFYSWVSKGGMSQ
jgi:predicted metalloprotease with PDZ domain